jgi:hypothetical protein
MDVRISEFSIYAGKQGDEEATFQSTFFDRPVDDSTNAGGRSWARFVNVLIVDGYDIYVNTP